MCMCARVDVRVVRTLNLFTHISIAANNGDVSSTPDDKGQMELIVI